MTANEPAWVRWLPTARQIVAVAATSPGWRTYETPEQLEEDVRRVARLLERLVDGKPKAG